MKGEIYNFVLFSSIGDGTVANKSFFVDWSILPESRYKLTFSFASSNLTISQRQNQGKHWHCSAELNRSTGVSVQAKT